MKIISWNINGIRAIIKKGFVDYLKNSQPDIILLQEIKIDNIQKAKHDFDFIDYQEFFYPAERPGYAGTAILTRLKPKNYHQGLNIKEFDSEGRTQTMEFDRFYLINHYFPNTGEDLKRLNFKRKFNKSALAYWKQLVKNKPVIIGGDFNVAHQPIDIARPKENEGSAGYTKEEREDFSNFLTQGFVDSFRYLHPNKIQYSWWSYRFGARARNIGWRIDYFLVSSSLTSKIKNAWIDDKIMGSDHAPIGLEI